MPPRKHQEQGPDEPSELKGHWEQQRQSYADIRKVGKCVIQYVKGSTRFHLISPYDKELVKEWHNLGGRWRRRSQVWTFKNGLEKYVREHLLRVFGPDYELKSGVSHEDD